MPGDTGDGVLHLDSLLLAALDRPRDLADLLNSGPVEVVVDGRRGHQPAMLVSAMSLVHGFGGLPLFTEFALDVGGKRPPPIRRRP